MKELLAIKGLSHRLPNGQTLLHDIDLQVESGQLVWVSGSSGGGKTTFLKLLNRLLSPYRGGLRLEGRDYSEWPIPELRRKLALLPQSPVLIEGSIEQNLLLPFKFKVAGNHQPPGPDQLKKILALLGLDDLALDRSTEGLSLGQNQRIGLGRLLLMKPIMLLLDEPLASLDEDSRGLALDALLDFAAQGGAVLMVSHIAPEKGEFIPYKLDEGRLRPLEAAK